MIKPNVGMTDKLIRYTVGVILISLNLSGIITGALGIAVVTVALVILITGIAKFCPLYSFLGWTTWHEEPKVPGKYH